MKMNQDELDIIIGKNVKKYRKLYNKTYGKMTQEDLAEIINVSVSLISNLESSSVIKGISINKISIVLRVPISKFFEDDNDE